MSSIRVWLTETLTAAVPEVGGRVFPRESMSSSEQVAYPYLVYGLGNSTSENLGEDPEDFDHEPERQFFQVWIHDKMPPTGGSYLTVDDIIPKVKAALSGQGSAEDNIINTVFLETSGEFSNKTLGTLFRYVRFQSIRGKAKP